MTTRATLTTTLCFALLLPACGRQEPQRRRRQVSTGKTPAAEKASQKAAATQPTDAQPDDAPVTAVSAAQSERGLKLFAQHCAGCHGEKGGGDGIAAKFLYPKPRDFGTGYFRLIRSAESRMPTAEDIEAVLERGMPGSSMVPWRHLPKEDRHLLALQVLQFRRSGLREKLIQLAKEQGEEPDEEMIAETVEAATELGDPLDPPEIGQPTQESIARGKEIFLKKGCASCHGKTGKGDGQEKMVNSEGIPERPRDLTSGFFKGSDDPVSVYRRIAIGMPGSSMPASLKALKPQEMIDLTHFVLSLSDQKTRDSTVLKREKIIAKSVATLPDSADSDAWSAVKPTPLRVTALWWVSEFDDPNLQVQAAHDGKALAVRMSWKDSKADGTALHSESFADAAAVGIFGGETATEPFLGMGAKNALVEAWMWRPDRSQDVARIQNANPNIVVDWYPFAEKNVETASYDRPGAALKAQAPFTVAALASGNQITPGPKGLKAATMAASGPGSLTFLPPVSQVVASTGKRTDDGWVVVMKRPLQIDADDSAISLKKGDRVSATFAVWDGAALDRDGKKKITVWQDLLLE